MTGARPVFADIDPDRLTLDPRAAAAAVTPRTRAIMPVHLYGQPADMPAIMEVAARHSLAVVEDCCQAHLATCGGRPVGSFGVAAAYSFYPTKNLGALGDGGALTIDRRRTSRRALRRLRNGGQTDRYHHVEFGVNSRLDEMQAAILRARLAWLPRWTAERRALAAEYRRASLAGAPSSCRPSSIPATSITCSRSSAATATRSRPRLKARGIETLIHYPVPIPRQPALAAGATGRSARSPTASAARCFSLPLHPGHDVDDGRDRRGGVARASHAIGLMRVRRALLLRPHRGARSSRVFEIALRTWGHSEAAPVVPDAVHARPGHRLPPAAQRAHAVRDRRVRHRRSRSTAQGVRDDTEIGPKPAGRAADRRARRLAGAVGAGRPRGRRSAQLLEDASQSPRGGPVHYRVINAGVQGYGPVEELLFFREVARAFQPDLVIETIFVGNDAEEAVDLGATAARRRAAAAPTAAAPTR